MCYYEEDYPSCDEPDFKGGCLKIVIGIVVFAALVWYLCYLFIKS